MELGVFLVGELLDEAGEYYPWQVIALGHGLYLDRDGTRPSVGTRQRTRKQGVGGQSLKKHLSLLVVHGAHDQRPDVEQIAVRAYVFYVGQAGDPEHAVELFDRGGQAVGHVQGRLRQHPLGVRVAHHQVLVVVEVLLVFPVGGQAVATCQQPGLGVVVNAQVADGGQAAGRNCQRHGQHKPGISSYKSEPGHRGTATV